jgi:hypothetical protein
MSYQQPPPSDEPTPSGSAPPPPPEEPAAPPPPPPADPAPTYEPPPAAPTARSGASGMTADQFKSTVQTANPYDLGIIGAGILAFLLSFFPYYTYSAFGFSTSWSAWHGFFGWFAALVALAAAALLALRLFGIHVLDSNMTRLACLVGFGVSLLCIILALFIDPSGVDCGGVDCGLDKGHGFGYWASAIIVIGGLVLSFMRKDATD